MNCKDTENLLIEYQDNTLDSIAKRSVENHIANCHHCQKVSQEFNILFDTINQVEDELPDRQLGIGFDQILEKEKLAVSTLKLKKLEAQKQSLKSILKIAAIIVLMVSSYLYGTYKKNISHINEMAILEQGKAKMQAIATLSLLENESASKRLQAVNYAKVMDHPNMEILNVLITKMNNDNHVNVRIAAANALSKFATKDMVREALIKTLEVEENANMQIELIQILVDIEEKRAIPTMQKLLDNTNTPAYIKEHINYELQQII